jgi:hypothetical protein
MGNHGFIDTGDWLAMGLLMLLFLGALTALGVWLVRASHNEPHSTDTKPKT